MLFLINPFKRWCYVPAAGASLINWGAASLLVCWLILSVDVSAAPKVLRIAISNAEAVTVSEPSYYFEQLLNLALTKTAESDGPFTIVHNHHGGGIERDRALLVSGVGIDVMWGSVTKEREAAMRVIPVDLLKSLNNYRVLLIRKDKQTLMNSVKTLGDLRGLTMGSGVGWTDTAIMSRNGFTIVDGSNYSGLFKMLAAGRFDFMSRGVHEAGYDMALYAKFGLALEDNFLLKYSVPVQYSFYVNKHNLALAQRLERGLKLAQEDGSFDALFYQVPSLKSGMDLFKSSTRIRYEIDTHAILQARERACCGGLSVVSTSLSKPHP